MILFLGMMSNANHLSRHRDLIHRLRAGLGAWRPGQSVPTDAYRFLNDLLREFRGHYTRFVDFGFGPGFCFCNERPVAASSASMKH